MITSPSVQLQNARLLTSPINSDKNFGVRVFYIGGRGLIPYPSMARPLALSVPLFSWARSTTRYAIRKQTDRQGAKIFLLVQFIYFSELHTSSRLFQFSWLFYSECIISLHFNSLSHDTTEGYNINFRKAKGLLQGYTLNVDAMNK